MTQRDHVEQAVSPERNEGSQLVTDFDAWHASFRAHLPGEYSLGKDRNDSFAGSVRTRCVSGLTAVEVDSNNHFYKRTLRDIRHDEADHFTFAILVYGRATVTQNDRELKFVAGDCTLINRRRPFSYAVSEHRSVKLLVPRRLLISAVGFEPRGAESWRSDMLAVRLLSRLILDAQGHDPTTAAARYHMQLAICDLLGALMASNDLLAYSSHKEKTFARLRDIVKHHFTDPEIGPLEIANEAGISLRYLQKSFTARGTTCSRVIQSLRLHHAARLVHLRNLTKSGQPLTDIAHLSGFREYSHFARLFREHFGHSPVTESDLEQSVDTAGRERLG
jgi:AraC family transcriptional regulator, positive regulator of tynA and feaB